MNPTKFFPRGKWRVILLTALSIVMLLGIAACDNGTTSTPSSPDITVGIKKLSESTAIQIVQQHVSSSGGNVTVQVPYWETSSQKVTCHGDPAFEGCYADDFSVTGFSKDIVRQERRCCRSESRRIPGQASWEAVYQTSDDEWVIEAEFSLDDAKQLLRWIVDDDSREVSESR